jgi:CHAD domain-containing protein
VVAIAATMLASAAVGVGVALARAERDRRWAGARPARDRELALWPGERPARGLRRMALGQLDFAIEQLEGDPDGVLAENAVHETRKSLKRLRALIRLVGGELEEGVAARENAVLRDAGRRLAGTRDAEVLVSTLEGLVVDHPGKLAGRPGVRALRARLVAERAAASELTETDTATRAQVLADLRAARERVSKWRLPDPDGIEGVEAGLSRIYRQGRRRYRAARGKGDRAVAMHMWRKRVKDLRYAAEMLDRLDPASGQRTRRPRRGERSRKHTAHRSEAGAIRRTARRADELGELLGEEHDLVLLLTRLDGEADARDGEASTATAGRDSSTATAGRDSPSASADRDSPGASADRDASNESAGRGTEHGRITAEEHRILRKLIARRRRQMRAKALSQGQRLYRRRPKAFIARTRAAYARAARR